MAEAQRRQIRDSDLRRSVDLSKTAGLSWPSDGHASPSLSVVPRQQASFELAGRSPAGSACDPASPAQSRLFGQAKTARTLRSDAVLAARPSGANPKFNGLISGSSVSVSGAVLGGLQLVAVCSNERPRCGVWAISVPVPRGAGRRSHVGFPGLNLHAIFAVQSWRLRTPVPVALPVC